MDPKTAERGVGAAQGLKSFEEEEERMVGVQMNLYQALAEEEVPPFPAKGRINHWWVKVLWILEEKADTKQVELERLVMLCCSISHGKIRSEPRRPTSPARRISPTFLRQEYSF